MKVLQRKRALLVKQYEALNQRAQRQLVEFVSSHNKAAAVEIQLVLIDRELDGMVDRSLNRIDVAHEGAVSGPLA